MLEQFVFDLPRDVAPQFGKECAACGAPASKRLALPIAGEALRRVELPACVECERRFMRRRSFVADLLLALIAFLALISLAAVMIQGLAMIKALAVGMDPEHVDEEPLRLFIWAIGYGALFLVGRRLLRVPTRPVVVTRQGERYRYAFVNAEAGRRFAMRNEAHTP